MRNMVLALSGDFGGEPAVYFDTILAFSCRLLSSKTSLENADFFKQVGAEKHSERV
jgi:hypothetical protein